MQLWLQQFWAMFTKRFYNSLRFYAAVISQIFFPILFILFGMILAVTGPGHDQDNPKRVLTLKNSALFGGNISLFYAQLGEINVGNTSFVLSVSLWYYRIVSWKIFHYLINNYWYAAWDGSFKGILFWPPLTSCNSTMPHRHQSYVLDHM